MDEKSFFWLCCALFSLSCCVLFAFVIFTPSASFAIDPYSTKLTCDGSCTFRGTVSALTDKNDTVFYKLDRDVAVDAVFFVGAKKPTLGVGDCVVVSGIAQTYKGKESIVVQTIRKCT